MLNENGFYYIHSLHDKSEAIAAVPTNEDTDLATLFNSQVSCKFPVGTILSSVMKHLPDFLQIYSKDIFALMVSIGVNAPSYLPVTLMMNCLKNIPYEEDHMKFEHEKIASYIEYIDSCANNKSFCSMTCLSALATRILEPLKSPQVFFITDDITNPTLSVSKSEMQNLITPSNGKPFKMNYYKIRSISDFFSATLQEVFAIGKIVKKCRRCDRYYITDKKTDMTFCRLENPEGKTCNELADLERRRNAYEWKRMSVILTEKRFYNKITDNDCNALYEKNEVLKAKLRSGEIKEVDYSAFLKEIKQRYYAKRNKKTPHD
jgi:hypothetical protein